MPMKRPPPPKKKGKRREKRDVIEVMWRRRPSRSIRLSICRFDMPISVRDSDLSDQYTSINIPHRFVFTFLHFMRVGASVGLKRPMDKADKVQTVKALNFFLSLLFNTFQRVLLLSTRRLTHVTCYNTQAYKKLIVGYTRRCNVRVRIEWQVLT